MAKTIEELLKEAMVPVEEQPYEVPENWVWVNHDFVINNVTSSKKKLKQKEYNVNGAIPVIDQGESEVGGYTDNKELAYDGELPVIVFGDHTKCIKYIDFVFVQGADGVKILKPNNSLIRDKYLYYLMLNQQLPDKGYSRHYKFLRETPIEIAPLSEQQRIVTKIESLFTKIDKAKELIEEAREGFENRKAAILAKAFRGELTTRWREEHLQIEPAEILIERIRKEKEKLIKDKVIKRSKPISKFDENEIPYAVSETWTWVRIDDIVIKVTDGEHSTPIRSDSGYYLLSARNIRNGYISLEDVDYVQEDEFKRISKRCDPSIGDILISCSGTIGRVALVDKDNSYVMVRSAAMVRPLLSYVSSEYIAYVLRSSHLQSQMIDKSKSTAQANLFLGEIRSLLIPLPPLEEQQEIVRILDNLLSFESKIEELTGLEEQIELLKKSILAKAFRGELGTNDPTEESATQLLKEVLSQK